MKPASGEPVIPLVFLVILKCCLIDAQGTLKHGEHCFPRGGSIILTEVCDISVGLTCSPERRCACKDADRSWSYGLCVTYSGLGGKPVTAPPAQLNTTSRGQSRGNGTAASVAGPRRVTNDDPSYFSATLLLVSGIFWFRFRI